CLQIVLAPPPSTLFPYTTLFRSKDKKATLLLMNLAISSFQNRMAKQLDISPGQEMIQGFESAEEIGANLVLADRDIQITFSRIRSEEHTSELQSRFDLVCRLLLE